jgi:hypothetical protein
MKLLTVVEGKLVVHDRDGVHVRDINSLSDFVEAYQEFGNEMGCSSTVDFPEESTNDPAVIELCHQIRN